MYTCVYIGVRGYQLPTAATTATYPPMCARPEKKGQNILKI